MNEEYKPITNLWKDSEGYRYFGTLKLSSKIKYDGDDFIPLWEWFKQLQQENKILKENAENNDKIVDKVNWENMLLKKENEQLKKQLEENKDKINWYENFEINKTIDKLRIKHNNQQKEFIEYMNKTIEELECDDVDDEEMKGYLIQRIDTFKEILSKYKEIIGDDK